MAAISPTYASSPAKGIQRLRNVVAQATVGQTDWIEVPKWATAVLVYFNLTANAGTTPISTVSLRSADPLALDDTRVVTYVSGAAVTAQSYHEYQLGPTLVTVNADNAAAAGFKTQNAPMPSYLGVSVVNDRTTGDETYTYTLAVEFKG